jgi:hypothetical protein
MSATGYNLSPAGFPAWPPWLNPYHKRAWEAGKAVRLADRYQLEAHAVPHESGVDVAASSPYEGKVKLYAPSWLVALSASASQADGFEVQIRDAGTGQDLFSSRIRHDNLSAVSLAPGRTASQPWRLPVPRVVVEPGLLVVQILNRATVQNTIQLVLWVVAPENHP